MAKFTPGPLAGAISGGIGNTVFTRNRYGSVLRIGVMPTKRTTVYTLEIRNRFTLLSKAWGGLDDPSRASWETWAANHPFIDKLGQSQVLQGSAAFIQANANILKAGGSMASTPVVMASPDPISGTVALTAQQPSTASLAWTSGALGATEVLFVWGAVVQSNGRKFYKNLLKLITVSAAAQATPLALGTPFNNRFGYLKEDSVLFVHAFVVDKTSGLVGSMAYATCAVAAAP